MKIFRITLGLSGDNLQVVELLDEFTVPFFMMDSFKPDDYHKYIPSKKYGFGSILITNPKKFCNEDEVTNYEEWYLGFFEKYFEKMLKFGAEEFSLFIEVFYNGQCNFEIFDKEMLSRLAKYNVSLPISIYRLELSEINSMLNDAGLPTLGE